MTKVFYIVSFLLITHFTSFAQSSVNDYKYILIPSQFEFLKERDQFQINSLTKFLFNKYGYSAFMQDEELPEDLRTNRCLGLLADVVKENGFMKTRLRIDLKDCDGTVVQSSKVGESREKDYGKAYNLALRDAFETFQNMNYAYQPNAAIVAKTSSQTTVSSNSQEQEEIARLKYELKSLKEEKPETITIEKPMEAKKVVEVPMQETTAKEVTKSLEATKITSQEVLYAQAIDNGFQLVDQTPKVVMILLPTGAKDVFSVKDKNAIVYKKDKQWIYSENDGKDVKETLINIKF